MGKTRLQQQQQIVMAVDRDTGIVDLSVFAKPLQGAERKLSALQRSGWQTYPKWYGC